jgi:O-antigen ligase
MSPTDTRNRRRPAEAYTARNGNGVPVSPPRVSGLEAPSWLAALPLSFVALLLLLATWWEGAFDLRHWGPPALFALVVLASLFLGQATRPIDARARIALAAVWGFAVWSLLSGAWAEAPAGAWEGGARALLYAALATLPLVTVIGTHQLRLIGSAITVGVAVIAVATLAALHVDGKDLFLAGRLDAPVGYRNATACLFALSFWPLIGFAAARGGTRVVRAGAFSAATLALGLAFLTQSRGVWLGLAAGAVVMLSLGPDRVRRAWLALLALGGIGAVSGPLLAPYHAFDGGRGVVSSGDIELAAGALTAVAAIALLAGFMIALLDNGLRTSSPRIRRLRPLARAGLAAGAIALAAGGAVAVGNPVDFGREKLDEFRGLESRSSETTRLGLADGQRYDLWRIAWKEFESHPLKGVGEGSYEFGYYVERRTNRNLSDPHSLPLRILAETGAVGAALFAAFLIALAAAAWRGWRFASRPTRRAAAGLAAAGAVVLGQGSVDWFWLIPGVMGLGIFCLALAAALLAPPPAAPPSPGRRWAGVAVALALLGAAASVLVLFLSDFELREARARAGRSPAAQLSEARAAERLNPWSAQARYLQASALETLGRRGAARAELRGALDLEPRNFATLGLLGDVEVRAGNAARARAYYRRALALNPRDVGLRQLANRRVAPER